MADNVNTEKGRDWCKKNRMFLLKLSCAGLLLGFFLAHLGGVNDNKTIVPLSFAVLGIACLLPIIAKK